MIFLALLMAATIEYRPPPPAVESRDMRQCAQDRRRLHRDEGNLGAASPEAARRPASEANQPRGNDDSWMEHY